MGVLETQKINALMRHDLEHLGGYASLPCVTYDASLYPYREAMYIDPRGSAHYLHHLFQAVRIFLFFTCKQQKEGVKIAAHKVGCSAAEVFRTCIWGFVVLFDSTLNLKTVES